jgi:stromal membrane-associated protein
MDINMQIKILEALLKLPDNRECSDCNSKTPRWASITFGTFVCLRCSGQHRQLQVHITKIKSVNLDKWAPEMLEMYKHVNNTILNAYWEARLPRGYNKPGQNATSQEVESFIRDKYVNRRWVDTALSADPANLYWNDRKKFDKFILKVTGGGDG